MDFNKKNVFTTLNADEVKIGSKVVLANNLEDLIDRVECEIIETLQSINGIEWTGRFVGKDNTNYNLCYLVSGPEHKSLKWTDLKVGDKIKYEKITAMVVCINHKPESDFHIKADRWLTDKELAEWTKE